MFFRAAHPDSRVCTIIASRAVARRGLILLSWDERGKVTRVSRLDAVVQGRLRDDARDDSREFFREGFGSPRGRVDGEARDRSRLADALVASGRNKSRSSATCIGREGRLSRDSKTTS